MRTVKSVMFQIVVLYALVESIAWGVVPITLLGEKADVILLATLQTMTGDGTGGVKAQLQPISVLKGQMPVSPIAVELAPSPLMKVFAAQTISGKTGATGLWFLKQNNNLYEVLPTEQGQYTQNAAFLPMPPWWLPPATGTLHQKLLSAVVSSYQSLANPSGIDEGRLLISLENADRQDALAIADQLMAAQTSIEHRIMGFAAAVRMGSDDALLRLAQEIHTLRSGKMFDQLIWALQTYYQPNGNSSIPVLRQLIELRSDVPGLDVAVGKALQKIGTKEVLPTMALLLDSQDPLAKSTAAWFFHFYTAMAGPDGNINRSGDGQHPFWSDDSRRYAPRRNSNITPDEYASYWKTWWAQNRAQVGFPAP